jgi:hypothetical protein
MDNKLAAIKQALEMGAYIEIKFHDNKSDEEAMKNAEVIASQLGKEVVYKSYQGARWFDTPRGPIDKISFASFCPSETTQTV